MTLSFLHNYTCMVNSINKEMILRAILSFLVRFYLKVPDIEALAKYTVVLYIY